MPISTPRKEPLQVSKKRFTPLIPSSELLRTGTTLHPPRIGPVDVSLRNPALVNGLRVHRRGRDLKRARNLLSWGLGLTVGTLGRRRRREEGLDPGLVDEVKNARESSCEEEVQEDALPLLVFCLCFD